MAQAVGAAAPRRIGKREIGFIAGIIVFLLVKFLPLGGLSETALSEGGQTCLALTLGTVVWWACGVAQPGYVGVLYCVLLILFQVCTDDAGSPSLSATVASTFSSWTKATMWLVIGVYLIASAVKDSGLGERIAYAFMLRFVKGYKSLVISIFALTLILSLLIPHPFPRAFLILAVVSVIASSANYGDDDKAKLGFLVFAAAPAASTFFLTGDSTLNPLVAQYSAEAGGANPGFIDWFLYMSVPMLVALLATMVLGLLLVQGEYDVSIAASPIAADGTVYTIDGASQHLSFVAEDAAAGELPACSFSLAPVAAAEVTDDQIDAAWRYAADDASEGAPDAQALRTAAEKRRDDAVRAAEAARQEAARKAAEEARHVVADSFELYLPAYWDGRVEADVEGDSVTIRSSEYRRLDICTITVQDGPSQVMGDIATSCMGSVPLGGGKYAVVWANRWAYIIGDAYMRNSSDSSDYYSLDEASEIVDLQTGGAYTYIEIRDDMVATDRASDLLFSSDPYLQEVVVNAIEPR